MHTNLTIKILISPLALIFRIISGIRNKLFDIGILQSKHFSFPVIGIGNITVGGTGKTPHIEYLIQLLKDSNKIAVLSRGYKRKTKGFIESDYKSTSLSIGDEPMQMKKKFGDQIIVAVSEDRVKGIKNLMQKHSELDVILLDDSYQHRYVDPGMNILLVDYNRPIFKDQILPLGELRESKYNYDRANVVIVSKCPEDLKPIDTCLFLKELNLYPYQKAYFTGYKYGNVISVRKNTEMELENMQEYEVLLITGIAQTESLLNHLNGKFKKFVHLKFNDHYNFKEKDILEITSTFEAFSSNYKIILTTEKDAVRLMDIDQYKLLIPFTHVIPVQVEFLNNEEESFNNQIISYVREDKRNS